MQELQRPTPIASGVLREPSPRTGPPDEEREVALDVGRYFRVFKIRWELLLAGALIGAGAGLSLAQFRPILYEGVTTLLVVPPPPRTPGVVPPPVNPATFRAIVENASLAAETVQELRLNEPPHDLTPSLFLTRAMTVQSIPGTNVVKVIVWLRDPKLAAEASRRLGQKAIELTRRLNQLEGTAVQEQLQVHLNEAASRLAAAERDLLSYQQSAQVELLAKDAEAVLGERGDLLKLLITIESEKASLTTAEALIKDQSPTLTIPRAVGAEEALRRTDGTKEVLDPSNPFVNPVYQSLDFQIATSRARLAALEQQRRQIVDVRQLGGEQLGQLRELYNRRIELARLQTTFDLAKRVHSDLLVRYEESRTQSLGNSPQLQLVDAGVPPDRPLSRRRSRATSLGAAAGLLVAGLVALLWDARKKRPV